jgi:hypothetical protein
MLKLRTFSTISTVDLSSQPYNFLCVHFFYFFNRFEISIKFCGFDTHIDNIWEKYFLGYISTLCKLLSQMPTKWRKKRKKYFTNVSQNSFYHPSTKWTYQNQI